MGYKSRIYYMKSNTGVDAKEKLYYHADTGIFRAGLIIINTMGMECKSYPYSSYYKPKFPPWSILSQNITTLMYIHIPL